MARLRNELDADPSALSRREAAARARAAADRLRRVEAAVTAAAALDAARRKRDGTAAARARKAAPPEAAGEPPEAPSGAAQANKAPPCEAGTREAPSRDARGVPRSPLGDPRGRRRGPSAVRRRSAAHLFGVVDRNPLARETCIVAGVLGFDRIAWEVIASRNFAKTVDDPTRPTRAAAEVLIKELLPLSAVKRVVCWDSAVAQSVTGILRAAGIRIEVEVRPKAYFSAGA